MKLLAFLIGAGAAGIAGAIFSYRIGFIEPSSIFSLTLSINVVLMTIVGGAGTWQGPLIGVPLILLPRLIDYNRSPRSNAIAQWVESTERLRVPIRTSPEEE